MEKKIKAFLEKRQKTSKFQGVFLNNEKYKAKNGSTTHSKYWTVLINMQGKDTSKRIAKMEEGTKFRAAICSNLWLLKLVRPNLTVNFKPVHPYYLYLIATVRIRQQWWTRHTNILAARDLQSHSRKTMTTKTKTLQRW